MIYLFSFLFLTISISSFATDSVTIKSPIDPQTIDFDSTDQGSNEKVFYCGQVKVNFLRKNELVEFYWNDYRKLYRKFKSMFKVETSFETLFGNGDSDYLNIRPPFQSHCKYFKREEYDFKKVFKEFEDSYKDAQFFVEHTLKRELIKDSQLSCDGKCLREWNFSLQSKFIIQLANGTNQNNSIQGYLSRSTVYELVDPKLCEGQKTPECPGTWD
ncbi:MAG: hypothetical protein AB7I27_14415 [Bacteriovoracaceae bacterium]